MPIALYPGSFDPVTYAHLDIAVRATRIFDRVILAVFDQPKKNLLFTTDERVTLIQEAIKDLPQVEVTPYSGLTVDFAHQVGAVALVRGLRTVSDFELEYNMSQLNQALDPAIEVVVLMASRRFAHISSSAVREIAGLGREPEEFVPPHIIEALRRKFAQRG